MASAHEGTTDKATTLARVGCCCIIYSSASSDALPFAVELHRDRALRFASPGIVREGYRQKGT